MRKGEVEVLAPAGSYESMQAAVSAGADAVYIGGSRFGARAYADNLTEERMLEAIDYAHLRGVSLYMTVNTLVKEREMDALIPYLEPYYRQGLDAVIVQDPGVARQVRRYFPDLAVHASTQMTITGVRGARIAKEWGATRVVPARELSLEEIQRIREELDIEIECFVHGALCYCYSGQCLLSSFIGGRSGNRGRCAQPCRLPYEIRGAAEVPGGRKLDRDDRCVMSLKDLCTLDLLPQLLEAGVNSLKIEGRMKSPRYTAGVVSIYRKYVDRYLRDGSEGYRVDLEDKKMLLDLFDRGGFTEGYFRQHNGRDMIALKEKPAFRPGNQKLQEYLDETYVNREKKVPIRGRALFRKGEPLRLKLSAAAGPDRVLVETVTEGKPVQPALNQPLSAERIEKQLRKTGQTPYVWEQLEVETEGSGFLPMQDLNQWRRAGLEQLTEAMAAVWRRDGRTEPGLKRTGKTQAEVRDPEAGKNTGTETLPEIHVLLDAPELLAAVLEADAVSEIQMECDSFAPERWQETVQACHKAGRRCVLAMPAIFRQEAEGYFDRNLEQLREAGFDGILIRSLEEADYLKQHAVRLPVYGDFQLYAWNREAAAALRQLGLARLTFPLELNERELNDLGSSGWELPVYGYMPAMVSAQCVQKTYAGCTRRPGWTRLKDRTGKELPVRSRCAFCFNTIYNPLPLSLFGLAKEVRRLTPSALRLQFTRETEAQARALLSACTEEFWYGREAAPAAGEFTRGHFRRGAE